MKRKDLTNDQINRFVKDTKFEDGLDVALWCLHLIESAKPEDDIQLSRILVMAREKHPSLYSDAVLNSTSLKFTT